MPLRSLLSSFLHSGSQRRCFSSQVVVLSLWAQHHMAAVGSVVSRVGWGSQPNKAQCTALDGPTTHDGAR